MNCPSRRTCFVDEEARGRGRQSSKALGCRSYIYESSIRNHAERHPIAADSSPSPASPLFTSQFFLLCGFTFTTFISAFLLFPTMPFRILSLGKSKAEAGLFLGFITYASAFSAPLGGALADRVGKKPILLASSAAILCFSVVYGHATQLWLILLTATVHGFFWSALLASSAAMMVGILPDARRAEGLGYWGRPALWQLRRHRLPGCGSWNAVGAGSASAWVPWPRECS
jgi:MFS family permease